MIRVGSNPVKGVLIRRGGFGPRATQKGETHGGTQCAIEDRDWRKASASQASPGTTKR